MSDQTFVKLTDVTEIPENELEQLQSNMPWADDKILLATYNARMNPAPKKVPGVGDPNSTSSKIRAMYRATNGKMSGYAIANALGITPQFVHNVLKKIKN